MNLKFNLITLGLLLRALYAQYGKSGKILSHNFAQVGFVIAWIIIAYAISMDDDGSVRSNSRTLIVFGLSAAIVFSVFMMRRHMDAKPPIVYPILFALSWIALGYMVGHDRQTRIMGVIAAIVILISMKISLPWDSHTKATENPALPFFVVGWALIAFTNSLG